MNNYTQNLRKVNNNDHIAIAEFIATLVSCKLLLNPGEADVIARNVNRKHPDYGFMRDIVATRAAHKRGIG